MMLTAVRPDSVSRGIKKEFEVNMGVPSLRLLRLSSRGLTAAAMRPWVVATAPHATVTVGGGVFGGDVRIVTNMESDHATVAARCAAGTPLDPESALAITHGANGVDFAVTEASGQTSAISLDIAVPASFSVVASRSGAPSNLRVDGWLEGGVSLTTARGDVGVKTVRGMLTTLATGEGNLALEMIEGDANLSSGKGNITIGKLQGKALRAKSGGGDISARAIYTHDCHLATRSGTISLGFLHTERAQIEVADGGVRIDALDGSASVRACEKGWIRVQLSDGARELELSADGDIEILVPEDMGFRAEAHGKTVSCDPGLLAHLVQESDDGEVQTFSLARARKGTGTAGDADGGPGHTPITSVRAKSTGGMVTFKQHSWLDRFKAKK
jgi:hypothetical protein